MLQEQKALESTDHVHSADRTCLKNTFGPKCGEAPDEAAPAPSSTDVPVEDEADVAASLVEQELGGEVVSISAPGARNEGECGFQPESYKKFEDAPDGCGKDLTSENKAKVNLTLLRAKTTLCGDCFDAWKAAASTSS